MSLCREEKAIELDDVVYEDSSESSDSDQYDFQFYKEIYSEALSK
jgi:hypothetical protein